MGLAQGAPAQTQDPPTHTPSVLDLRLVLNQTRTEAGVADSSTCLQLTRNAFRSQVWGDFHDLRSKLCTPASTSPQTPCLRRATWFSFPGRDGAP